MAKFDFIASAPCANSVIGKPNKIEFENKQQKPIGMELDKVFEKI